MLHQELKTHLKEAMKAKDAVRLTTIRGILSEATKELVNQKKTPQDFLTDEQTQAVIKRIAKQRKDSIAQFTNAGRDDLADEDQAQLNVLQAFLPETLSKEKIAEIVTGVLADMSDDEKANMGMVMKAVMPKLAGQADGADVKEVVQNLLS